MARLLSGRSNCKPQHAFGHMGVHGKNLPLDGVVSRAQWLEIDGSCVVSQLAQLALADHIAVRSLNRYLAERDLDTFRELNAHLPWRLFHSGAVVWDGDRRIRMGPCKLSPSDAVNRARGAR